MIRMNAFLKPIKMFLIIISSQKLTNFIQNKNQRLTK